MLPVSLAKVILKGARAAKAVLLRSVSFANVATSINCSVGTVLSKGYLVKSGNL
jgi:hypothetical protein